MPQAVAVPGQLASMHLHQPTRHRQADPQPADPLRPGVGIAAESLPRLFERFRRVEEPRARSRDGSGIGLALIQELVRLPHGRIDVQTEV